MITLFHNHPPESCPRMDKIIWRGSGGEVRCLYLLCKYSRYQVIIGAGTIVDPVDDIESITAGGVSGPGAVISDPD